MKYVGAAGTTAGCVLKTLPCLRRVTETAKAGNYSRSGLGQEKGRKGQGDKGKIRISKAGKPGVVWSRDNWVTLSRPSSLYSGYFVADIALEENAR